MCIRDSLAPAPRLAEVFGRHDAADRQAELRVGEVHQHQREQEVGRGEADVAEESEAVVAPAVLPRGGVEADRERDRPGEQDHREVAVSYTHLTLPTSDLV